MATLPTSRYNVCVSTACRASMMLLLVDIKLRFILFPLHLAVWLGIFVQVLSIVIDDADPYVDGNHC